MSYILSSDLSSYFGNFDFISVKFSLWVRFYYLLKVFIANKSVFKLQNDGSLKHFSSLFTVWNFLYSLFYSAYNFYIDIKIDIVICNNPLITWPHHLACRTYLTIIRSFPCLKGKLCSYLISSYFIDNVLSPDTQPTVLIAPNLTHCSGDVIAIYWSTAS